MGITNSDQSWAVGDIVAIGFLKLRVAGFSSREWRSRRPDSYRLESINGNGRAYEFTPYHGLERVK
jgi:hypothetical protein